MNKQCAKCSKTVYPVEQLRCLDKTWHKGCFTCETCGMTLTMKNYKGYNKLPYCQAHYPTTKHTAVADTPEGRRLAKQSKTQSQVEYHKAFVQGKGQKISVADDPETARAKKNTQNQSQIVYTGHQQTRAVSEQNRPEDPRGQGQESSAPHLPPSMNQPEPPASPDDYDPVQQFETAYNEPSRQPVGSLFDSPQPAPPAQSYGQKRYVALYDYTAADSDEVSFVEGDYIINWQHVDEGWMTGTVQRTNQTGMLPSNYVEQE